MLRLANLESGIKPGIGVNLTKIIHALWNQANINQPIEIESIEIKQLSVTGNMPIDELRQRKIKWNTTDDEHLHFQKIDDNPTDVGYRIQMPQDINVYSIEVIPQRTQDDVVSSETDEDGNSIVLQ